MGGTVPPFSGKRFSPAAGSLPAGNTARCTVSGGGGETGGAVGRLMTINWWKVISNPFFSFISCIIALILSHSTVVLFIPAVFVFLSAASFIVPIKRSNGFSVRSIAKSLFLIIPISILSFFSILLGALAVIYCIWIFCILFSIVSIIMSIINNKNHILNYILLISILVALIGGIFVKINTSFNEKELLKVAHKIEDYYANTDKKYNDIEINILLNGNKKYDLYNIQVEDDSFMVSVHLRFAGGLLLLTYNSADGEIYSRSRM
jgi:hypothetical protein